MKSVKHRVVLLLLFMILVLSGCASEEEKSKASETESLAEPIIKQYIVENYPGYKIDKTGTIFVAQDWFNKEATSFVKATISKNKNTDDEDTFHIIYNTESNKIYSDADSESKLEEIKETLDIDFASEIDVSFLSKELKSSNIDAENYYNIKSENLADYDIYLYILINKESTPTDLYDKLSNLNDLDYYAKVVTSEDIESSKVTLIKREFEGSDDIDNITKTIIRVRHVDGKTTESIQKYSRVDIDSGYIIYDSLKYSISVEKVSSSLGGNESSDSSKDSRLSILSINSNNRLIDVSVFSEQYNRLIYMINDTLDTVRLDMSAYGLLSFKPQYCINLILENALENTPITLSLYNTEKEDKN